jgi:Putative peptidoglycan binding domain/Glycosyl hydrolase family 46
MAGAAAALARGSFGDLVALLQGGLTRSGHYTRTIDGDFGGGTETAVRSLQTDSRRVATGRADPATWEQATGIPWPGLFERCLQLTARFEGHGYKLIAGNFDGAGLTWGIIGFTLQHGEIQAIVNEVATRAPALFRAFGDSADELLTAFRTRSTKELVAWADGISVGKSKQSVVEPWRSGFAALGAEPLVQEIQRRRAMDKYFTPALVTANRLELDNDLGTALCFDIHVQNGGVKARDENAYNDEMRKRRRAKTPLARRELLATLVADSARKAYRDDVFARKNAIATGQGITHGHLFTMSDWGLADD